MRKIKLKESTIKILIGAALLIVLLSASVYYFVKNSSISTKNSIVEEKIDADKSSFEKNTENISESPFKPIIEDPEKVFKKSSEDPVGTK